MIYQLPAANQTVDQGDIIDGCPILQVASFDPQDAAAPEVACSISRVVMLTQTCDLAHRRTQRLTVAVVHNAQLLVDQKIVKAADVRGPIRAARVYGWYFLPADNQLGLEESIVDLRQLHTVPLDVLNTLCQVAGGKGEFNRCIASISRNTSPTRTVELGCLCRTTRSNRRALHEHL